MAEKAHDSKGPFYFLVFCGDCGCMLSKQYSLAGHRREGVYRCPASYQKGRDGIVTIPELSAAVRAALMKERDAALSAQAEKEQESQKILSSQYDQQISVLMEEIRSNCAAINGIYAGHSKPGPLPEPEKAQVLSYNKSNWGLAGQLADLEEERFRYRQGFVEGDVWIDLYTSLPPDFTLTRELLCSYTQKIEIFHDTHILVTMLAQKERAALEWSLSLPAQKRICPEQRMEVGPHA